MNEEFLYLSTVTPVYRGAAYLEDMVRELGALRQRLADGPTRLRLIESIFVVDDAVDSSESVLHKLAAENEWVHVVVMSTNYGQHAATVAGILHSSGDWIATLDEDLQHPPEMLPELLASGIEQSGDLVYASPKAGPHRSFYRNLTSKVAKKSIGWVAGNSRFADFNSFRVGRGSLLRAAAALAGHGVYLDVALSWFTRRVVTKQVELNDPRVQESGYSFMMLVKHAWRLLMSSDFRPFRLGSLVGGIGILAGLLGIAWTFYVRIFDPAAISVQGWASLFTAILFFGGSTTLLAGFTLEYVVSIHQANLGRPVFLAVDRSKDALLESPKESDET